MKNNLKYIDLADDFRVMQSFSALKKLCKSKQIPIKRVAWWLQGNYNFKPNDVFGRGNMRVAVHTFLGKITDMDIYWDWREADEKMTVLESFEKTKDQLLARFGTPDKESGSIETETKHYTWMVNDVKVELYLFEHFNLHDYLRVYF